MRVKTVIDERFDDYHTPAMFIGTISCGGKCCIEAGIPLSVCQNDGWRSRAPVFLDDRDLCKRYINNPVTHAVIFGGLEPFEQFEELQHFIYLLRTEFMCDDDVVIYTGYYPDEIKDALDVLRGFKNIIIKFGRYIPNRQSRYDEILGVTLASDNQYAERIS